MFPPNLSLENYRKPMEEESEIIKEPYWMENWTPKSMDQGSYKLTVTEQQAKGYTGQHQVRCVYIIALSLVFFIGLSVNEWVYDSCTFSWSCFPSVHLLCPASMLWFLFYLILFHFVKNYSL